MINEFLDLLQCFLGVFVPSNASFIGFWWYERCYAHV